MYIKLSDIMPILEEELPSILLEDIKAMPTINPVEVLEKMIEEKNKFRHERTKEWIIATNALQEAIEKLNP